MLRISHIPSTWFSSLLTLISYTASEIDIGREVVKPISTELNTSNFQSHSEICKRSDQVSHRNTYLISILCIPYLARAIYGSSQFHPGDCDEQSCEGELVGIVVLAQVPCAESVLTEVLEHEYTQHPHF